MKKLVFIATLLIAGQAMALEYIANLVDQGRNGNYSMCRYLSADGLRFQIAVPGPCPMYVSYNPDTGKVTR